MPAIAGAKTFKLIFIGLIPLEWVVWGSVRPEFTLDRPRTETQETPKIDENWLLKHSRGRLGRPLGTAAKTLYSVQTALVADKGGFV